MKTMTGSIFGKKLLMIKEDENDYMNNIVQCPYCGRPIRYGETMMISGIIYCPVCRDKCIREVMWDKENDYEAYTTKDYQPYGVEKKVKE